MKFIEIENNIKKYMIKFYKDYHKIFFISFAIINLAFLFHTINFMFGDHDWNHIKSSISWNEGTFEGRPLHFVLQSIFFNGQILPVINNIISFMLLTLSGILLAKYWNIPKTILGYSLFSIFIALQPYTLAWLFYAKDSLINLSLPFVAITSLLISENKGKTKNYFYHIFAILLMYFSFASYVAIINYYGVCVIGKLLFTYIDEKKPFITILRQKYLTIIDLFVALILFKITISQLLPSEGYNTQTIPLSYIPQKLIETFFVMIKQFVTPLPFMEYKYKILLLILSVYAFIILLLKSETKKISLVILMIIGILFSSKLAYFIAEQRGQILAEMEDFAYVPRLDFYGLVYVYAVFLAIIIKYTQMKAYKIGIIFAIYITFLSFVRDVYAQKVWKFGFDAEIKVNERILSKIEQHKDFYPTQHYKLLQIGSLSLRQNFYQRDKKEITSLDLLSTSFTPEFMSRIAYNFYYPYNIFVENVSINSLSEDAIRFILYKAEPYPSDNFLYIDRNIIIVVLTEEGLHKEHQKISNIIPK